MISNLLRMGFGVIDTLVAGQLGTEALTVVAVSTSIFWFVLVPITSLLSGYQIYMIRAYGAKDMAQFRSLFTSGLVIALLLSFVAAPCIGIGYLLYTLSELTPDTFALIKLYLYLLIPASLFLILYVPFQQYWYAKEKVKLFTLLIVLMQPVNYGLNIYLSTSKMGGFNLGVIGIALSTSICKFLELLIIFVPTFIHWRKNHIKKSCASVFRQSIKPLTLGLPSAGHAISDVFFFSFITFVVSFLGSTNVATHQIIFIISCTFFSTFSGWSTAVSIKAGHALGAGAHESAGKIIRAQGLTLMVLALIFCLVLLFQFNFFGSLFTDDQTVITTMKTLWLIFTLFLCVDILQGYMVTVLQCLGETKKPFIVHFIGLTLFGSGLAWLAMIYGFGLTGIWSSLLAAMVLVIIGNLILLQSTFRHLNSKRYG